MNLIKILILGPLATFSLPALSSGFGCNLAIKSLLGNGLSQNPPRISTLDLNQGTEKIKKALFELDKTEGRHSIYTKHLQQALDQAKGDNLPDYLNNLHLHYVRLYSEDNSSGLLHLSSPDDSFISILKTIFEDPTLARIFINQIDRLEPEIFTLMRKSDFKDYYPYFDYSDELFETIIKINSKTRLSQPDIDRLKFLSDVFLSEFYSFIRPITIFFQNYEGLTNQVFIAEAKNLGLDNIEEYALEINYLLEVAQSFHKSVSDLVPNQALSPFEIKALRDRLIHTHRYFLSNQLTKVSNLARIHIGTSILNLEEIENQNLKKELQRARSTVIAGGIAVSAGVVIYPIYKWIKSKQRDHSEK